MFITKFSTYLGTSTYDSTTTIPEYSCATSKYTKFSVFESTLYCISDLNLLQLYCHQATPAAAAYEQRMLMCTPFSYASRGHQKKECK